MSLNKVSERMILLSPTVEGGFERESNTKDFEILKSLGAGAYGKVYKCRHKQNQNIYAVKQISKKIVKLQKMQKNIINEIKIMYSLDHQNIIRLFNHFEEEEFIYLVLEFAENGQLYEKLQKEGPINKQIVQSYLRDIVESIEYLHKHNIIHRDIKPENLLISHNNRIKVADFGWSTILTQKMRQTYCGTLEYLAPEMINGQGHDLNIDLWSIGILLYELLTGRAPFLSEQEISQNANQNRQKILEKNIIENNISFPNDFCPYAKDLCLRLLRTDPKERISLKQVKEHKFLSSTLYGVENTYQPQTQQYYFQDIKLILSQESNYSFDIILRCANTGSIISNQNLNHNLNSNNQTLNNTQLDNNNNNNNNNLSQQQFIIKNQQLNKISQLELQIEDLKKENSNLELQFKSLNNIIPIQSNNTQEIQQLYETIKEKDLKILSLEEQVSKLKDQVQKQKQQLEQQSEAIKQGQIQIRDNKNEIDRLNEEILQYKTTKEMNKSSLLKSRISQQEEDVGNLIKADIKQLIKELDQKIQSYKEVSSEINKKDTKILELLSQVQLSDQRHKIELQDKLLDQERQIQQENTLLQEQIEEQHRKKIQKLEQNIQELQMQIKQNQQQADNQIQYQQTIASLQSQIKIADNIQKTRESDWELSKIYIKKLEDQQLENNIEIKNLKHQVAFYKKEEKK